MCRAEQDRPVEPQGKDDKCFSTEVLGISMDNGHPRPLASPARQVRAAVRKD